VPRLRRHIPGPTAPYRGVTHDDHPATRPDPLRSAVLRQRWEDVSFLHWPVPEEAVADRLPVGLEPDLWEGTAWVGLVAFRMVGIGPARGPAIPYLGSFPETNVRTYVRGRDGRPGVWFDSLDASRLLPVLVARSVWNLPYLWSAMAIEGAAPTYRATRRWPDRGRRSTMSVEPRGPAPVEGLAAFLVNRWRLFTADRRGRPVVAEVDHEPWPLHHAEVVSADDGFVAAAGYPLDGSPPIAHHADGVSVRAGRPAVLL
jgi:uncharacterized protein YqjF (DUF2071 family)